MRQLVADLRGDMAANDYWACDRPDATEDEIYSAGVADGLGGEAGDFAAAWTPAVALEQAALLEHAALGIETLMVAAPDVELPSLLVWCVRVAEAFLRSQPHGKPDSRKDIEARLAALRVERDGGGPK